VAELKALVLALGETLFAVVIVVAAAAVIRELVPLTSAMLMVRIVAVVVSSV
jgi:hypothetical protein